MKVKCIPRSLMRSGKPKRKGVKYIMTTFKKRVASAIAAGSMLLQLVGPAFAQVNLEISGNGTQSNSDVNLSVQSNTSVVQNNNANINNNVTATSNTGGNDVNDNTGGNVSVDTGNANTTVGIANTVNSNSASVDCCLVGADVLISGNGSYSDNTANLGLVNQTTVVQNNTANLTNDVYAKANTGKNDANDNTGGNVSVNTGNATTGVLIANAGNANYATIGDGGEGAGTVSLRILGNGTGSDNDINLALVKSLSLVQDNNARLNNNVEAKANTGKNDANDNTNGDVEVDTGNAYVTVGIDNMVNFNFAELNCGCILDVLAKISGNGSDTDNTINASLVDAQVAFQTNAAREYNDVEAKAKTGKNDADDNTGGVGGDSDPSIDTGNSSTDVLIENAGNVNFIGDSPDLPEFPEFPGLPGFEVDFGLNLSFLWLLLGLG